VSEILFNKKASVEQLQSLNEAELRTIAGEIPSFTIDASLLKEGVNVIDLIAEHSQIVQSKGDARRAIKGNALSINKAKVTDHTMQIGPEDLLCDAFIMIENGKKNKFILEVK
jgi:tyrosyl-tRNA synthetase